MQVQVQARMAALLQFTSGLLLTSEGLPHPQAPHAPLPILLDPTVLGLLPHSHLSHLCPLIFFEDRFWEGEIADTPHGLPTWRPYGAVLEVGAILAVTTAL